MTLDSFSKLKGIFVFIGSVIVSLSTAQIDHQYTLFENYIKENTIREVQVSSIDENKKKSKLLLKVRYNKSGTKRYGIEYKYGFERVKDSTIFRYDKSARLKLRRSYLESLDKNVQLTDKSDKNGIPPVPSLMGAKDQVIETRFYYSDKEKLEIRDALDTLLIKYNKVGKIELEKEDDRIKKYFYNESRKLLRTEEVKRSIIMSFAEPTEYLDTITVIYNELEKPVRSFGTLLGKRQEIKFLYQENLLVSVQSEIGYQGNDDVKRSSISIEYNQKGSKISEKKSNGNYVFSLIKYEYNSEQVLETEIVLDPKTQENIVVLKYEYFK